MKLEGKMTFGEFEIEWNRLSESQKTWQAYYAKQKIEELEERSLPSDEEIEKEADEEYGNDQDEDSSRWGFAKGAKWMREKAGSR